MRSTFENRGILKIKFDYAMSLTQQNNVSSLVIDHLCRLVAVEENISGYYMDQSPSESCFMKKKKYR